MNISFKKKGFNEMSLAEILAFFQSNIVPSLPHILFGLVARMLEEGAYKLIPKKSYSKVQRKIAKALGCLAPIVSHEIAQHYLENYPFKSKYPFIWWDDALLDPSLFALGFFLPEIIAYLKTKLSEDRV
jgi:hypothetical protein